MAMEFGLSALFSKLGGLIGFGAKQFAFDKIFETVTNKAVDTVIEQSARWGGLTRDDEAILKRIDTSVEFHFPGSLKHIIAVRQRLNEIDPSGKLNRNWRMTLITIKVSGSVKERKLKNKKSTTRGGNETVEEFFEDVERQPSIFPADDVRVRHLRQIANIAKNPADGINKAVEHLQVSYLNDDTFFSRMKGVLIEVATYIGEVGGYSFQFLATGLGKGIAHFILGSEAYQRIEESPHLSPEQKKALLVEAIRIQTDFVRDDLNRLKADRGFLGSLRRHKAWAIILALLVAIPFIIRLS